jgi:hypothetical protein
MRQPPPAWSTKPAGKDGGWYEVARGCPERLHPAIVPQVASATITPAIFRAMHLE